jgi:hypothetical protein
MVAMSPANRPQNLNVGKRLRHLSIERAQAVSTSCRLAYEANGKVCPECGTHIPYEARKTKFCNLRCAASYNNRKRWEGRVISLETIRHREERQRQYKKASRQRIRASKTVKRLPFGQNVHARPHKSKYPWTPVRSCKSCARFHTRTLQKYCDTCSPNIRHYRSRAAFRFNVYEYPDEFDLPMVNRLGWYSPTGRCGRNRHQMNLTGVSRDHVFTVSDGFRLGIDPELLAHPANCEVIPHSVNSSKDRRKSRISFDELVDRIRDWDLRYGKRSSHQSVKLAPVRIREVGGELFDPTASHQSFRRLVARTLGR